MLAAVRNDEASRLFVLHLVVIGQIRGTPVRCWIKGQVLKRLRGLFVLQLTIAGHTEGTTVKFKSD
jgi:hypothetical protein